MRAGKLDRLIYIERKSATVTGSGATVTDWTNIGVVRAEIVETATEEFLAGYGEADRTVAVFRIRYRPDITTADRIMHDGVAYDVKRVVEIGRRRGLELRAVAVS
ncbi:phage head closure protein [Aquibium microcysteis]|uniref:phage head closure protein n=1 Tax=Aquibium microcysteis TaxID=675281 RepID=UPI00165D1566|nr:phage head closure protein [Aquibium microcysteis]